MRARERRVAGPSVRLFLQWPMADRFWSVDALGAVGDALRPKRPRT